MKTIIANKRNMVKAPLEFKNKGIEFFQIVDFEINYFGKIIKTTHDTKILTNGKQLVIGGCGYIEEGYEVA